MAQQEHEPRTGCYDHELDFQKHEPAALSQRYLSSKNGKCKRLQVQSKHTPSTDFLRRQTSELPITQPDDINYERVVITDNRPYHIAIAVSLYNNVPRKLSLVAIWILKWFLLWPALLWEFLAVAVSPYFQRSPSGMYPQYLGKFWDQFWEAKSSCEYSLHDGKLKQNPLLYGLRLPASITMDSDLGKKVIDMGIGSSQLPPPTPVSTSVRDIVRTEYPRQLMVNPQYVLENLELNGEQRSAAEKHLRENTWMPIIEGHGHDNFLKFARYLAVSYRRGAYRRGPGDDLDPRLAANLIANIRSACQELEVDAYWIDEQCMGKTWEEKNLDLFRIADVFRGAYATVIMLPSGGKSPETEETREWQLWGDRIWTFPEGLLGKNLHYKLDTSPTRALELRRLANIAFRTEDRKEAAALVDYYSGKDDLSRLQFLSLLKDAIWRRPYTPNTVNTSPAAPPQAERVYALMGFFQHRIMPDNLETEEQALARLSMANDSDRFTERMISMLPQNINESACWYSDNDIFDARLWDIEPTIQVAGITETGSLIFDGCRAACIRWKNFPNITRFMKRGFKRIQPPVPP